MGEQCAEKGETEEEGASRQCDSVPVSLRQPQSRGKGMAAAPGAFIIWGSAQSGAVASRGSAGSNLPSWQASPRAAEIWVPEPLRAVQGACLCI